MTRRSLLPNAVCLVLALACARAGAADVVARVGKVDVTSDQVRAWVETLGARDQAALAKDPALLNQVVRSFLARQAVLGEARTKRWDQEPSVKAQLERVREEALTELYLDHVSRPPESYPSDAEVQSAYAANRSAFEVPPQYRIAQIFVAGPKGDAAAEEKGQKRIQTVVRKLRDEKGDFSSLAQAESDDKESASRGGEIGWLAEAQMVPGIRKAVMGLAKGGVTEALRLDDGWHVVKLLDTRPASMRPLAEVRAAIASQLRAERAKANRQAYLAKLLDQNPPAVNELVLSNVLVKGK
jgi:peptidylprolyl isomerase